MSLGFLERKGYEHFSPLYQLTLITYPLGTLCSNYIKRIMLVSASFLSFRTHFSNVKALAHFHLTPGVDVAHHYGCDDMILADLSLYSNQYVHHQGGDSKALH